MLDPNQTFISLSESVGLDVRLTKAIMRLGHTHPTLVQSKCLPLAILEGRDLMVRARTGSGKTLAYTIPLLQKVISNQSSGLTAVVLVPSRELCTQVRDVIDKLTYYCDDVSTAVLSVGRGRGEKSKQEIERQEASLRDQPKVIVATPAGILAHLRSKALHLKSVETLVVDEADLVLSFGYSNDIAEIAKALPRICQGFLMSATLSPELDTLKKIVLNSPVVLKLEEDENKHKGHLKQFYLPVPKKDKNLVTYFLLKLGFLKGKGLFFVRSLDGGYRLKLFLEQFHIRSAVLNAELPFRSRLNIIEQFNVGNFDYLIATDSSTDAGKKEADSDDEEDGNQKSKKADSGYGVARGLDFQRVAFVVNFDFPPNTKSYSHRVGRTARGGARGVALSFVEIESKEQQEILVDVQADQPGIPLTKASSDKLLALPNADESGEANAQREQPQPVPLDFDLGAVEGFRYRCEDVQRAVTRLAVRGARAAELKAEILNSERLQSHFDSNPNELQLLRHDRTHTSKVHDHLKHVPKYLLPRGMQVVNLNKKRKKKRIRRMIDYRQAKNDPLKDFDGDVNLDGVAGDDVDESMSEFFEDDSGEPEPKRQKQDPKIFNNTRDGTGKSTAGRNTWKERHRKGQFSSKKRMKDRKYKEPLGI